MTKKVDDVLIPFDFSVTISSPPFGESGISYKLPSAPFEFQFSYSETPKAKPVGIREPAFMPLDPPTMPRQINGELPPRWDGPNGTVVWVNKPKEWTSFTVSDKLRRIVKVKKVQFDQFVAQGRVLHNYANILELLLRLRQCCNHPFLFMSRADSQQYADLDSLARRFLDNNSDSVSQKAPSRAYIEEVIQDIRDGNIKECPICLESADDPILTPCAHKMCRECLLTSWRSTSCGLLPICRTVLKKTELISCPTESIFRVDVVKNWKESSKVSELIKCLEKIRMSGSGTGEKSIVFSQWTSFLDLLEIPLRKRGWSCWNT
ncbi:unnamed protein product [Eruca vesicaria subsp. sativa]|uniref:RING-type domain-containing protein n=1 Tax=Eruca vesicaria subsp. sativa TaxID=29727 RepID=A0ABC8JN69_ERUVS|nr:unnamed protein product [Eruca vesicaria subsp. sativa]